MEELTLKNYPLGVLENLIGSRGKQQVDNKLTRYGYSFTSTGRGKQRVYTITALPDAISRFKSYCVFSLGFDPHTEFRKLRDWLFYFFWDEGFNGRSDEMMEEYLRLEGNGISRQTIGKYRKKLEKLNYIASSDFVYYRIWKEYGVQRSEVITREEYSKAWKSYFEWREAHPDEDSRPAYAHMYNKFGGVPRKQAKLEINGIYKQELNTLNDLVCATIEEEIGD